MKIVIQYRSLNIQIDIFINFEDGIIMWKKHEYFIVEIYIL